MERPGAYVPGFEHDIFISYAHADDEQESGHEGAVSTFVELLKKRLTRYLGGADKFAIWMDRTRITGHFQLTKGMENPLQSTGLMLAFLSRAYLASEWCPWERDAFARAAPPSADGRTRMYFVELDRLDERLQPKECADAFRYRFWKQGANDRHPRALDLYNPATETEYKDRIDELARDLRDALDEMKARAEVAPPTRNTTATTTTPPPPAPRPPEPREPPKATVYLAETTDDLEPAWRKVKSYLEQHNIAVVPPRQDLPREPDAFRQAVKAHMADAQMFVQLLSLVPGRQLDEAQTYVSHQYQSSRDAGLPALQWRDPRLSESERGEIENAVHRDLLEGPMVQAVQIEEFRQNIVQTLERLRADKERQEALEKKQRTRSAGKSKDQFVFILADQKDSTMAEDIFKFFDEQGFPCGVPITIEAGSDDLPPDEIRRDFEDNIQKAAGTVIVYGNTPPTWYRSQLSRVRQVAGARCELGLAICPPPKKILYKVTGLHQILFADGIDEKACQTFMDALTNTRPSAIVT